MGVSSRAERKRLRWCSAWIKEHGQAIISGNPPANTPGVNGTGTLLGVVVKALPWQHESFDLQVNAKDSSSGSRGDQRSTLRVP